MAKEKQEYDYEGDMAMSQLKSIIANAQRIHDSLKRDTNLPEWVQSKITLAEDYISTAANYLQGEVKEEAPANAVGGGNIAGMGVGPNGEPGVTPKAMKKYKSANAAGAPKAGRKSFGLFLKGK